MSRLDEAGTDTLITRSLREWKHHLEVNRWINGEKYRIVCAALELSSARDAAPETDAVTGLVEALEKIGNATWAWEARLVANSAVSAYREAHQ